ncbi:MAG TPA: amidohydrolase family protein [Streptosporangiaceae bacterium]|nr:amidohydrolase family protein [Streptosporangiaceae bacterium]
MTRLTAGAVAVVTGGTVVTPDGKRRADVLIRDGKIAALDEAGAADGQRVDASGCYVLPGGVDPHCHLMPDVRRATAAAARGGTTTVLSFSNPGDGEADLDALLRCRAEVAGGRAAVDVGLHAVIYDPEHASTASLAAARRAGAGAIKIFLAYAELGILCSTRRLFELMSSARQVGLLVQVHCENGPLIDALTDDALSAGRRGARVFADTRPPEVEEEAVARVLAVAALTGAACYLVHLSTAQALDQVRLARLRSRPPAVAEVCTHHLLLDDRCYAGTDAARYLVAPPLRPAADLEAMWRGVADGTIDTVGSDHCQARSPVPGGLAPPGENHAYGLAGIGARVPLLLAEGLARGVPIGRLAQLAAANPARAFGHYPRKGALVPGADADITVFDPAGQTVLDESGLGDGTGDSVYAGRRLTGSIRAVLVGGRAIVSDGELIADGSGRYLPADDPPVPGPRASEPGAGQPGMGRPAAATRCSGDRPVA